MNRDNLEKPLRVCLASFCYITRTTQKKLLELAKAGLDIHLITMPEWTHPLYKVIFHPAGSTFTPHMLRAHLNGVQGGYFFSPLRYFGILRKLRPDVLHVDAEPFAVAALHAAIYSRLLRIPLVMFCWENTDRYLWRSDEPGKRLFFLRIVMRQFVLSTVRHFCCGNAGAARLVRKWGFRGGTTVLPQFGVDVEDYPRRESEPQSSEFIVGFVGRLIPEKGIDVLIRAAAKIRSQGVPIRVLIVGKGPEEASLQALAVQLGIAEAVEFAGAVRDDQVAATMAGFHVLVLPSRTTAAWKEQFGKVLIEAMLVGLPVLGSRSGEIPNVICDERQTFDEGDAADLAAKLLVLQKDGGLRRALIERNLQHVLENYTQEVVARQYAQVWTEVFGRETLTRRFTCALPKPCEK